MNTTIFFIKKYIYRIDNKKNGKYVKFAIPTKDGLNELQKVTEQLAKPLLAIEKGISEKRKILLIKDLQKIQSQIEKLCGKLY